MFSNKSLSTVCFTRFWDIYYSEHWIVNDFCLHKDLNYLYIHIYTSMSKFHNIYTQMFSIHTHYSTYKCADKLFTICNTTHMRSFQTLTYTGVYKQIPVILHKRTNRQTSKHLFKHYNEYMYEYGSDNNDLLKHAGIIIYNLPLNKSKWPGCLLLCAFAYERCNKW